MHSKNEKNKPAAITPSVAHNGWWRAQLHRADGQAIVFNFEWTMEKGKPVWSIRNASERINVTRYTGKR